MPCLHWGAPKWMIFLPFPYSYASIHLNVSWFHSCFGSFGYNPRSLSSHLRNPSTSKSKPQQSPWPSGSDFHVCQNTGGVRFCHAKKKSKIFGILEVPKLKESSNCKLMGISRLIFFKSKIVRSWTWGPQSYKHLVS